MKQYPKLPDNKQPYFILDARETKRNNICLFYLKDFFWIFLFSVYLFLVHKLIFQIISNSKNYNIFCSSCLIIYQMPNEYLKICILFCLRTSLLLEWVCNSTVFNTASTLYLPTFHLHHSVSPSPPPLP